MAVWAGADRLVRAERTLVVWVSGAAMRAWRATRATVPVVRRIHVLAVGARAGWSWGVAIVLGLLLWQVLLLLLLQLLLEPLQSMLLLVELLLEQAGMSLVVNGWLSRE